MPTKPTQLSDLIDASRMSPGDYELRKSIRDTAELVFYELFPVVIDNGRVLRASLLALQGANNG